MRVRCEQLTYALAAGNASRAESLAQDCVHYWLVAAAALRRLERDNEGRADHCRAARRAVPRTARLLLTLLDCGVAETAEPTRAGFAQLRLGIELATASRDSDPDLRRPPVAERSSIARAFVVSSAARSRASR